MTKSALAASVPKAIKPRYDEIVALTDAFCRTHLNDEYADLACRMTAALSRKRPSPLASGQARVWACSIVYTLGQINFLADATTKPHMAMADLCAGFGVAQSTAGNKAASIRKAIKANRFDPTWSLQSLTDKNPFIWMLEINGFIIDVRNAPRQVQQFAFDSGLIPYIPDEKL
jgi:hypothetical protein